jgi:pyruvate-formate lyase-activating enzyme
VGPLAEKARQALIAGARTIQILGGEPTIHVPAVVELVSLLPDDAHLVWKTNGHGSAEARRLLDGLFDTWLVDFKFGNDRCGERLARVSQYLAAVRANLAWAQPRTNLIVRHLLMPGHLRCCWKPVAAWIARELPGVKVSLRTGFWPAWHSSRHPELIVGASREDTALAWRIAADYGLNLVPSGIDLDSASAPGRVIPSATAAARGYAGKRSGGVRRREASTSAEGEILILPDGRVLSHNTTTALAGLMQSLSRAGKESHEFSG